MTIERKILVIAILLLAYFASLANSLVEFTNIKCESLNKEYMGFEYCHLKSVNRTYKYLSLKANLYNVPINNFRVNFALYKRLSGYKPFLYNITLDACKFYHNPRSNPVAGYVYDFFKDFSNINHSCPYDHDVFIDKLTAEEVNRRVTKILPFPEGNYMLQLIWFNYNIKQIVFKIYFAIS